MSTRVFLLDTGTLAVDQPGQVWQEPAIGVTAPVFAVCVVTDSQNILVDTGFDPAWFARNCPGVVVGQREDQTLQAQLTAISLRTDEIDTVINTHLHVDNCGGNRYFPGARFIVSRTELRHAFVPDASERLRYEPRLFQNPGGRQLLLELGEGESFDLADGITIISTPGHCSGHLSVLVMLQKTAPLIITGDAAISDADWQSGLPSGDPLDPGQAVHSLQILQRIASETGAMVLHPHDPAAWATYRHAPEFYGE